MSIKNFKVALPTPTTATDTAKTGWRVCVPPEHRPIRLCMFCAVECGASHVCLCMSTTVPSGHVLMYARSTASDRGLTHAFCSMDYQLLPPLLEHGRHTLMQLTPAHHRL